MSEQNSPPTPARTDAARRVLAAARALFTERGVDGVSIRDVAVRAGVSKANVFHHFGNKARLYDAVLEDARLTFDDLLDGLRDHTTPSARRLERFARAHLETMLEEPASVNLFLRQMLNPRGDRQRERAEETVGAGLQELLTALDDLPARRSADADAGLPPLAIALTVLGGTFMYFQLRTVLPRLETGADCDPAQYCDALMALLRPVLDAPAEAAEPR